MTKILLGINAIIAAAAKDEVFTLCSIVVWIIVGVAMLIYGNDKHKA